MKTPRLVWLIFLTVTSLICCRSFSPVPVPQVMFRVENEVTDNSSATGPTHSLEQYDPYFIAKTGVTGFLFRAVQSEMGNNMSPKHQIVHNGARRMHATPQFQARLQELRKTIHARHAGELSQEGFFRRQVLRWQMAVEFRRERRRLAPSAQALFSRRTHGTSVTSWRWPSFFH